MNKTKMFTVRITPHDHQIIQALRRKYDLPSDGEAARRAWRQVATERGIEPGDGRQEGVKDG